MTIPNVSMNWCQHHTRCDWCPGHIESGEPMVTVFFWNRGEQNGERKFNVKKYYHPQCWIDQGMDYLNRNPYVSSHKGREKMELSDEDKAIRKKLLDAKAAIDRRMRALDPEDVEYTLKKLNMEAQIFDLVIKIAPLGGVPPKWLEQTGKDNDKDGFTENQTV